MAYKDCHTEPTKVLTIGKATIWAGSYAGVLEANLEWALLIPLAGTSYFPSNPISASEAAKALLPAEIVGVKLPPVLAVDWPDRGIPSIPRASTWWRSLGSALKEIDGNVGIYCFGGHGRTGTALSILVGLEGKLPKKWDPVRWVRENYCAEAVESNQQLNYVETITGRKVLCSLPKSEYVYDTAKTGGTGTGTSGISKWCTRCQTWADQCQCSSAKCKSVGEDGLCSLCGRLPAFCICEGSHTVKGKKETARPLAPSPEATPGSSEPSVADLPATLIATDPERWTFNGWDPLYEGIELVGWMHIKTGTVLELEDLIDASDEEVLKAFLEPTAAS